MDKQNEKLQKARKKLKAAERDKPPPGEGKGDSSRRRKGRRPTDKDGPRRSSSEEVERPKTKKPKRLGSEPGVSRPTDKRKSRDRDKKPVETMEARKKRPSDEDDDQGLLRDKEVKKKRTVSPESERSSKGDSADGDGRGKLKDRGVPGARGLTGKPQLPSAEIKAKTPRRDDLAPGDERKK